MILAFALPAEKSPHRRPLAAGFAAVAVWMITDQYVLGHLEAHVQANYHDRGGHLLQEPERSGLGRQHAVLFHVVIVGLILVMAMSSPASPTALIPVASRPGSRPAAGVLRHHLFRLAVVLRHNLHPWGAFTVKPFMPTVFGEGKVAQFSTYSYPYWGYGLLLVIFVCLMLALLIRRKRCAEAPAMWFEVPAMAEAPGNLRRWPSVWRCLPRRVPVPEEGMGNV